MTSTYGTIMALLLLLLLDQLFIIIPLQHTHIRFYDVLYLFSVVYNNPAVQTCAQ